MFWKNFSRTDPDLGSGPYIASTFIVSKSLKYEIYLQVLSVSDFKVAANPFERAYNYLSRNFSCYYKRVRRIKHEVVAR